MTAAPRLRRDLALSRIEVAGAPVLIVKHPRSGRFYRFRSAERFIAEQLDGETSLDTIRARVEAEFDAALPPETLSAFVATLDKLDLLDSPRHGLAGGPSRPAVKGNLLYLRLPVFDPDKLFVRILPRIRFLFTREFVLFSAALILCAAGVATANAGDIARDLPRLYHGWVIPQFIAIVLVVATVHEFGHGLTCRHFGGEVHEVGFMLMYFQPVFYCNVSDAWLFPEKSRRLWVGFAGPYFELVMWATAIVTWRVTEPDTLVHYAALMTMAITGVRSFFDFNPFVKLDGYYLLSDLLEIPNLRRRSFKFIGDLTKRLLGLHARETPMIPRERRICFVYGLIATVSSVSLLVYGVVKAAGYLLIHHQPAALASLAGFAFLKTGRRFRRLFGAGPAGHASTAEEDDGAIISASGASDAGDGGAIVPATPATVSRADPKTPVPVPPGPPRHRRHFWVALGVAVLALVAFGQMELRIAGPFVILPQQNADVRAAVEGIIAAVPVHEGMRVKRGDVIVRLDDRDVRIELLKTRASLRQANASLAELEAGVTSDSLAVARAAVARTADVSRFADSALARARLLYVRNAMSRQDLQSAEEQATAAANDHSVAQAELALLIRGTRPEQVEAARAEVQGLEAQVQYLSQQLASLVIVSPANGVVATPERELDELRGRLVAKGALIAKVYAVRTVTAEMMVSEKEIGDVHLGQQVALRSRAYPDRSWEGVVTGIGTAADGMSSSSVENLPPPPISTSAGSVNSFIVTTEIENRDGLLRPGMTGLAKIGGGERKVSALVRRWLSHTFKVEFWSWW